jgi:hypothetical protein
MRATIHGGVELGDKLAAPNARHAWCWMLWGRQATGLDATVIGGLGNWLLMTANNPAGMIYSDIVGLITQTDIPLALTRAGLFAGPRAWLRYARKAIAREHKPSSMF